MNKYIPIYKYAQENNVSKQNVYRWIREGKIKDFVIEETVVKRIRINKESKYNSKTTP